MTLSQYGPSFSMVPNVWDGRPAAAKTPRILSVTSGIVAVLIGLLVSCPLAAQKKELTDQDVSAAVQYGSTRTDKSGDFANLKIGIVIDANFYTDGFEDPVDAYVFTPTEWIKWRAYLAAKDLKPTFVPGKDDLLPVLHVIVSSGIPEDTDGCRQISNVVLRDPKKTTMLHPATFTNRTTYFQNLFGAQLSCSGAMVTFDLSSLDKLRGLDPKREFLVSAVSDKGISDRKVKTKVFRFLD